MGRAGRWWVAGLVTVAAFAVTAWVLATFVLLQVMASAPDRWVVAAGAGTAVAAVSALWGQSWATRKDSEGSAGGSGPGRVAGSGGDRSVTAGGDISGIASTGDNASNMQCS